MAIRTISIDSTNHKTKLCKLGGVLQTDKSPYATDGTGGHRKGYTAVYELLFAPLKFKSDVNFLEIGIERGASTFLWEQYFENAKLYAFEHDEQTVTIKTKAIIFFILNRHLSYFIFRAHGYHPHKEINNKSNCADENEQQYP